MRNTLWITPVSSGCLHSRIALCSSVAASAIQHIPSMYLDWMTPQQSTSATTPDSKTSATSAANTSTTPSLLHVLPLHLHYTAYAPVPMHNVTNRAHAR